MISLSNIFKKNPVVDSVVDNFRTKTTNPFFGTLIAVWIFHNWRLVYMVFNFDKGTKLSEKLKDISVYLDGWGFVWNLLICVGIALVVVVLTYVFLGISKYFSGYYNEKISPKIDAMFGDTNIVSREKYMMLDRELGILRKENGEYKEEISAVEDENRGLDARVMKLDVSISKQDKTLRENEKYIKDYKETITDLERQVDEFENEKFELVESFEKSKSNFTLSVSDLKSKNEELSVVNEQYSKENSYLKKQIGILEEKSPEYLRQHSGISLKSISPRLDELVKSNPKVSRMLESLYLGVYIKDDDMIKLLIDENLARKKPVTTIDTRKNGNKIVRYELTEFGYMFVAILAEEGMLII